MADAPLTSTAAGPYNVATNQLLKGTLLGSFTDAFTGDAATCYQATVNYGAASEAATVVGTGTPGTFNVYVNSASPAAYTSPGVYVAQVHVVDADCVGATATDATTDFFVTFNVAGPIHVTTTLEHYRHVRGSVDIVRSVQLLRGQRSRFHAASEPLHGDEDQLGDGSADPMSVVSSTSSGPCVYLRVTGTHTYLEQGKYVVSYTITDTTTGATATVMQVITVNDAALTATAGAPINVPEGQPPASPAQSQRSLTRIRSSR